MYSWYNTYSPAASCGWGVSASATWGRPSVQSQSWLDMSNSEPASLLPNIHIFGIGPAFERIEIRKLDGENEPMTIGLRPAKFNLAITVLAIYKELIACPVGLCLVGFIR